MKFYTIMAYICNLGCVIAFFEPIIIALITFVKKYEWKIFRRVLILSIILFTIASILKIANSGIGYMLYEDGTDSNSINYWQIFFIISCIILELATIIYPIYAIKNQNSLKGEK